MSTTKGKLFLGAAISCLLQLQVASFAEETAAAKGPVGAGDSRLACPPEARVNEAIELIRAAYEAAYDQAKESSEPEPLIEQLLGLSKETPDPAKRYALLLEAEAVATQYENYTTALDLLAKRAEQFQIDGLKLKGQLLKRLAGPKVAADLVLFDQASDTAEQAVKAERFDIAAEAASLALSVAKAIDREQKADARKRGRSAGKTGKEESGPTPVGPGLVKKATALQSHVTATQKLSTEYGEALTRIKIQPDDAAANSAVAKYLCFVRGEWQKGLSALARSDLEGLKGVAAEELAVSAADKPEPKKFFELAGKWWSASESKGLAPDQESAVKDHAAAFYADVVDGLTDPLEKQLAKSRLRGLVTKSRGPDRQTTVFDFSRPNQLEKFVTKGPVRQTSKGLEFSGEAFGYADSRQSFSFPLTVTFVAATFPDKNLDCFPGIFVQPNDGASSGEPGVWLHWGTYGNTQTQLFVSGQRRQLRHKPIEAGRDNTITMHVNKDRQLTVLINDDTVHQEVLPLNLKLEGTIRCSGGVGHVAYKSVSVESPDRGQAKSLSVRNSIGIELKLIPAGTFQMGSNDGDADERPVHEVRISKPFYLGVTEVTNAQWKAVMGDVPSKWKDDNRPVEQVSWDDAVKFCEKLSALPEERKEGRVYRLPTEAEWEYACRAGTKTKYSFGDDGANLGDFTWFDGNAGGETHPVGTKKANPWGLHDMHGNVWEWCVDHYGPYSNELVIDPCGALSGSSRVHRGGSWGVVGVACRSAERRLNVPTRKVDGTGFRLALSPSGSGPLEAGSK